LKLDLYFKFKPDVKPAERARTLRLLRERGAMKVARLFPRTTQPQLKQHYVVEGKSTAEVRQLMRLLQSAKEVAFVHREVRRGPM